MNSYTTRKLEKQSRAVADTASSSEGVHETPAPLFAARREAVVQRELQETLNESAQVKSQIHLQRSLDRSPRVAAPAVLAQILSQRGLPPQNQAMQRREALPRQAMAEEKETLKPNGASARHAENRTGLPDDLKAGIENLSGMKLDDLSVHHNSAEPAKVQALAITQGKHIHLAPGQEKHLAHEAWHAVQQKQGRVKPTIQMKGVAINDDPSLETEADVMGARALQQQRVPESGDRTPAASASQFAPIQRQATYINYRGNSVDFIWNRIKEIESKQRLPPLSADQFIRGLAGVRRSPQDYGVIDLSDNQHVVMLYYYIRQQAQQPPYPGGEREEIESKRTERIEGQERLAQLPHRTVKIAFLGAGASIAYYIATLGGSYDPNHAVIIGPTQPWREQRGPGVVAHPEHMITPMREFIGDESINNTWLERGRFSDLIDSVLTKSRIPRIYRRVIDVSKEGSFYKITVEGETGPIYAREIVSGVGVGEHLPPRETPKEALALTPREVGPQRPIMSMDVFTRVADRLYKDQNGIQVGDPTKGNKGNITVILSGGNGGIDVAFDALNKGYKVQWIVGQGGPRFLPGFFNYAAYLSYLRALRSDQVQQAGIAKTPQEDPASAVQREISRVKSILPNLYNKEQTHEMFVDVLHRFMPETNKFDGIYFGFSGRVTVVGGKVQVTEPKLITGDIFVYAQGQDYKTFRLLDAFMDQLVPETDVNRRFTEGGESTLGLTSKDKTLKVIGATAFRLAAQVSPLKEQTQILLKELEMEARNLVKVGGPNQLVANVVWAYQRYVENADEKVAASLLKEFAMACKPYDEYTIDLNNQVLTEQQIVAVRNFTETLRKARTQAQGLMAPVIKTLPDNVLINDQLTPSRSQIEAFRGFVPYDIAQNVNFITDDRTALAVHISARYPAFADMHEGRAAAELIERIIQSRTRAVQDGPEFLAIPPHQIDFQNFWTAKLKKEELQAQFIKRFPSKL